MGVPGSGGLARRRSAARMFNQTDATALELALLQPGRRPASAGRRGLEQLPQLIAEGKVQRVLPSA
jgi:hypothetical protein